MHRIQPSYAPPLVAGEQEILSDFVDAFGLVGNFVKGEEPDEEARALAAQTAKQTVNEGVVTDGTVVEIRPFLMGEHLIHPKERKIHASLRASVILLRQEFKRNYDDVIVISNSHPILVPPGIEPPERASYAWRATAHELDELTFQLFSDRRREHRLAVLAITPPAVAEEVFGDQLHGELRVGGLAVLDSIGPRPEANILVTN